MAGRNFYIRNGLFVDIVGPRVCCSSVCGELKIQTTQIFFYASHTSPLPIARSSYFFRELFFLVSSTRSRTKNHHPPTRLPAPELSVVFGRPLSLFQLSLFQPPYIFQPIVPVYRHPQRFPTHQTRPHPFFQTSIARKPKVQNTRTRVEKRARRTASVYSRVLDSCPSKRSAGGHRLALLPGLKAILWTIASCKCSQVSFAVSRPF